ncbi:MAG: hypothetical protein IJU92_06580 [Spirochaetaceae bacterium]|nr:hypothetical protein [Spirochaetaceae bacterium]
MNKTKDLEFCIDFILNRCSPKQLDVVIAAVERKKKEISGTLNFNAEEASKRISKQLSESVQIGMQGMTESLRNFSRELIAREAPELSEEQAQALVDSWIPSQSYDGSIQSIAKNGTVSGLPAEAMYNMAVQFVEYGLGQMNEKTNTELKSTMGNWQEKYWKKFPVKIQQTIKDFFDGKTTYGECDTQIQQLLGLM